MSERDKNGRFKVTKLVHIDDHGYPRICSGPMKGKRLHTLVMEAKLGHPVPPECDVHHIDDDKLNFHPDNLELRDHTEHGYHSAKQRWFLHNRDKQLKKEWDDYHDKESSAEVVGTSEVVEL